jgi:hypothetical protein
VTATVARAGGGISGVVTRGGSVVALPGSAGGRPGPGANCLPRTARGCPAASSSTTSSVRRVPPPSQWGACSRKLVRWVDHLEGEVMDSAPASTGTWCPAAARRPVGGYLADELGRDAPHPCAIDGSARATERPDSTALSRRSLIKMRPLVQVQPGQQDQPVTSANAGHRVSRVQPNRWIPFGRGLGGRVGSLAGGQRPPSGRAGAGRRSVRQEGDDRVA